jgi:ATP-dependent DNA helicase RecG
VLVTTLALEDGPSIPGLVATVVEQADHVEQWRLHRVIGFLSTSVMAAVAVLVVGEHASSDAEARIQRVLDAHDGYALTEARVRVRGLAACVAEGGPPAPSFDALSVQDDLALVLAARAEAHRVLRSDPGLRRGSHQELARELRERWSELWPDADDAWTCPFTGDGGGGDRKRRRRRRRRR